MNARDKNNVRIIKSLYHDVSLQLGNIKERNKRVGKRNNKVYWKLVFIDG